MPVVTLSDAVFAQLQKLGVVLVDTPDTVISRLVEFYKQNKDVVATPNPTPTVAQQPVKTRIPVPPPSNGVSPGTYAVKHNKKNHNKMADADHIKEKVCQNKACGKLFTPPLTAQMSKCCSPECNRVRKLEYQRDWLTKNPDKAAKWKAKAKEKALAKRAEAAKSSVAESPVS